MSLPAKNRRIVVGVDGSSVSKLAVDWAARNAAMRNIALTVVNVIQESPLLLGQPSDGLFVSMPMPPEYLQWQQNAGREILDDSLKTVEEIAKQVGPIDVSGMSTPGSPVPVLVELSKEAEMVVVGRHGHDRGRLEVLFGSVTTGLVHHAHCPVAIIHDTETLTQHPSKAPVVVGIDGSPASESATAIAFDEAAWRGVELIALHACSDISASQFSLPDWSALKSERAELLSERLAGWQERYPDVVVRRIVAFNGPARELIEQSDSAQLVVVGSRGRGGFTGMLLGSVSTAVAQSARAPVIIAR